MLWVIVLLITMCKIENYGMILWTNNKGGAVMDLLRILEQFNRKERDYLIKNVIKHTPRALEKDFAKSLNKKLGIRLPQRKLYIAMDYHLDWLLMSVYLLYKNYELTTSNDNNLIDEHKGEILALKNDDLGGLDKINALHSGTQYDSDLLIVYKKKRKENGYVVISLEAKCDTSWNFDQLGYKLKRLKVIRDLLDRMNREQGTSHQLFFVMYSPNEIVNLEGQVNTANINRDAANQRKLKANAGTKNKDKKPQGILPPFHIIEDFHLEDDSQQKKRPYWLKMKMPPVLFDLEREEGILKSKKYDYVKVIRNEYK